MWSRDSKNTQNNNRPIHWLAAANCDQDFKKSIEITGQLNVQISLSAKAKCVAKIKILLSAKKAYLANVTDWYLAESEDDD